MSKAIPRWLITLVLALGVPVLFLFATQENAHSQIGPLACDEHELTIIDRDQLVGTQMNLALADVGAMVGVSPQSLVRVAISETEAAAVFPDAANPALVVSLEASPGGWSATHIEGCPELVISVDELNPDLGVQ